MTEESQFDFGNVDDWHTDPDIVKNGAPFDAGKGRVILVRRSGGANRKLMGALAGISPDDDAAFQSVYARLIVTGWTGFTDRSGDPIPYSPEACVALFRLC